MNADAVRHFVVAVVLFVFGIAVAAGANASDQSSAAQSSQSGHLRVGDTLTYAVTLELQQHHSRLAPKLEERSSESSGEGTETVSIYHIASDGTALGSVKAMFRGTQDGQPVILQTSFLAKVMPNGEMRAHGGLGIGGFDMETAARYKLPVLTVLWNNSSWGPNFDQMPGLKGRTDPFNMIPNIRYDKVFAEMGCHGEHIETPEQIIPALERAFKSGKPAMINVVGDVAIGNATLGGNLLGSTGSKG